MPGEDLQSWSTTAATNATADTSINWAEGQPRASVNNSARSMMAAHAKDRNLKNGSITTGGTANAQTFTSGVSYTVVPTGLWVKLKVGVTNTGATTLNMDGIGAVAIKDQSGGDTAAGALTIGRYVDLIYNGTNWILMQSAGAMTVPHCGRLEYVSTSALSFLPYNGDLIKINGVIYQIPAAGIAGLGVTGVFVNGVAAQNLVASTAYYVCAFNNAGVITADFVTLATGRAMSATSGNVGTMIKVADDSRTIIGLVYVVAGPAFLNNPGNRNVISWFNRRSIAVVGGSTAGASTASGPLVELTAAARIGFVTWNDESVISAMTGFVNTNVAGAIANADMYLDGATTVNASATVVQHYGALTYCPIAGTGNFGPAEGYHFLSAMGNTSGGGSSAFTYVLSATIRG